MDTEKKQNNLNHSQANLQQTKNEELLSYNQLAAGIAHEIRNPLTTVKGFMQLLRPYLEEIGKEIYVDIAIDELDRANKLIFDFLNASKPSQNMQTDVALNKLVQEMTLLFESEAILKKIDLGFALSVDEPVVTGDANQLKQVLHNIIKNAIEAILTNQQKGKIHLNVTVNGDKAYIMIEDNGCGMDEETLTSMYIPFFTTKQSGTGIGMSICKKIIDNHHGQINISSFPGKGTAFTIELPLKNKRQS